MSAHILFFILNVKNAYNIRTNFFWDECYGLKLLMVFWLVGNTDVSMKSRTNALPVHQRIHHDLDTIQTNYDL